MARGHYKKRNTFFKQGHQYLPRKVRSDDNCAEQEASSTPGLDCPHSPAAATPHTRAHTSEKKLLPNIHEYFIAHKEKLETLFNESFSKHQQHYPSCTGYLKLNQTTQKRGLSSTWYITCRNVHTVAVM